MKICRQTPNLDEMGQKYWAVYMKYFFLHEVCFIDVGDITQPQKHFCAAVSVFTLLTWHVTQQYTEGIAAFGLQQCSRERATVVRSAHVAYLVAIWNTAVATTLVILNSQ